MYIYTGLTERSTVCNDCASPQTSQAIRSLSTCLSAKSPTASGAAPLATHAGHERAQVVCLTRPGISSIMRWAMPLMCIREAHASRTVPPHTSSLTSCAFGTSSALCPLAASASSDGELAPRSESPSSAPSADASPPPPADGAARVSTPPTPWSVWWCCVKECCGLNDCPSSALLG